MESNLHWKYFLALDNDTTTLSRFIEPCEENLSVFSLEMTRMIMTATQECDVILKELCRVTSNPDCHKEHEYRKHLMDIFPRMSQIEIVCPHYQLSFIPFSDWRENKTPFWWTANNKVKHHRASCYKEANLRNVMNAIAGLLTAIIFLHKDHDNKIWFSPEPHNFKPVLNCCARIMPGYPQYLVP